MSTEPVRVSLEVTWQPAHGTWSLARREWRHHPADGWQLEGMAASGTPLTTHDLLERLGFAYENLCNQVLESDNPFGDSGPFVS